MSTTQLDDSIVPQPGFQAAPLDLGLTIDLTSNWQNTLPTIVAVLEAGNGEGRGFAKRELARLAVIADLGNEALAQLDHLVREGATADPDALALLARARAASAENRHDRSSAIADAAGEDETQPGVLNDAAVNRRFGMLARQCSGKHLPLEVCYSARGFYLGTRDSDGCPYSRESQEYWTKRDEAQAALDADLWTQLQHA